MLFQLGIFSLEEALEKSKSWIQNYEILKECGQKSVVESYAKLELLENDIRCLWRKENDRCYKKI